MKTRIFSPVTALCLLLVLFTTPAFAQSPNAPPARGTARSCEARREAVQKRMTQLVRLSQNMEGAFDRIAQRVRTYYIESALPSGIVVDNYDELVSNIDTNRDIIQAELANAQSNIVSFNCNDGNAGNRLTQYGTDMRSAKTALRTYRTSINSLIVAVRTASSDNNQL